jgi:hypothetical protein
MISLAFLSARRRPRTPQRRVGFPLSALALTAACGVGTQVAAQEVLHDPGAIRACLCEQQSLAPLQQEVATDRRAYDEAENALQALKRQAQQARQSLDPNDAAARGALGQILDRRDAAQDQLGRQAAPLNGAVARYNDAVAHYNSGCGGKSYDSAVLAEVQTGLSCPPSAAPTPRP